MVPVETVLVLSSFMRAPLFFHQRTMIEYSLETRVQVLQLFYFMLFMKPNLCFRKFLTKNRAFGNNTNFLQQFFRFRGGWNPPPFHHLSTPLLNTQEERNWLQWKLCYFSIPSFYDRSSIFQKEI